MKTADIAATIGYEVPGTYIALQVLARYQVVKQLPGKEPQHWEGEQKWGRLRGEVLAQPATA